MLSTQRLILRKWLDSDLEKFAEINAHPLVTKFRPYMTYEQSSEQLQYFKKHFDDYGYGLFAVEEKESGNFIGFIGLNHVSFEASFTPCVEIGYRLHPDYWGKGYATEGSLKVLEFAFNELNLNEIYAFTFKDNMASRRVMEKIGMHYLEGADFKHPKIPADHPLSHHVLYKIERKNK